MQYTYRFETAINLCVTAENLDEARQLAVDYVSKPDGRDAAAGASRSCRYCGVRTISTSLKG